MCDAGFSAKHRQVHDELCVVACLFECVYWSFLNVIVQVIHVSRFKFQVVPLHFIHVPVDLDVPLHSIPVPVYP